MQQAPFFGFGPRRHKGLFLRCARRATHRGRNDVISIVSQRCRLFLLPVLGCKTGICRAPILPGAPRKAKKTANYHCFSSFPHRAHFFANANSGFRGVFRSRLALPRHWRAAVCTQNARLLPGWRKENSALCRGVKNCPAPRRHRKGKTPPAQSARAQKGPGSKSRDDARKQCRKTGVFAALRRQSALTTTKGACGAFTAIKIACLPARSSSAQRSGQGPGEVLARLGGLRSRACASLTRPQPVPRHFG